MIFLLKCRERGYAFHLQDHMKIIKSCNVLLHHGAVSLQSQEILSVWSALREKIVERFSRLTKHV